MCPTQHVQFVCMWITNHENDLQKTLPTNKLLYDVFEFPIFTRIKDNVTENVLKKKKGKKVDH